MSCNNDNSIASEPLEGLQIDERVRALLKSFTFIPGRELETLGEVLQASFEHAQWEKLGAEGLSWHQLRIGGQPDQRIDRFFRYPEITSKEALDSRLSTFSDKDYAFAFGDFSDWYYLDGAGHEQWPSSFSELQSLVDQDSIQKHSSVLGKINKIWIPITFAADVPDAAVKIQPQNKANYASRICHLCRPNREAKITAVEGQYQIGIYTVRQIQCGEEIIFDYNSVTESKKEYEVSVCLCGSQVCRMSYLNLTGEGAFQKVLKGCHGILDQYQLMSEVCELNIVSEEVYIDLGRTGRERIKC
ncbi:hypothetical protein VitviT2T_016026 [Vitis vinifera]|uniref:SET domain-containing protein n=1 Tax=Vitis vinifera TaxID=29760 RepID=A0ABY9CSA9_VITVI|nr:hypothetical protein VitviT2T_016026 [Vitis vinifera]